MSSLKKSMSDYDIVEAALKSFGRLALEFRYGGLHQEYELAQQAKEAFERIKQPRLFDVDALGAHGVSSQPLSPKGESLL
jgi:hypothetical protein